jgi:hypothetical protein
VAVRARLVAVQADVELESANDFPCEGIQVLQTIICFYLSFFNLLFAQILHFNLYNFINLCFFGSPFPR